MHMYACVYACLCAFKLYYACLLLCVCVCIHVYVCMCVCVCVYVLSSVGNCLASNQVDINWEARDAWLTVYSA